MEIKNSLRQVKEKRGYVVQIHVCRKRVSQSLYFIIVFYLFCLHQHLLGHHLANQGSCQIRQGLRHRPLKQ